MALPGADPSPEVLAYYKAMTAARRRLIPPLAILAGGSYLLLNFLANFTQVLDGIPIPGISMAYVGSAVVLVVCVVVTLMYKYGIDKVEREHRPAELSGEAAAVPHEGDV